jgi:glyoxylase-like metal-dependent hydrolase (beta-lactamase superfamily II)
MTKKFASQADLEVKKTTFAQLSPHCWAYTAEGDPNTGVIITDEAVLICDALATPVMAQSLIAEIRKITDKPIKYVVLSHYHAVRVLGASGYKSEGMQEIIASQGTYEMIVERGAQDMQSEYERFPRLFNAFDSIPGLTWPSLVFQEQMTLYLSGLEVKIMHVGAGHTKGDTIVWVPSEKVLFSGDLMEADAACYTGDAQLEEWPATLDALAALKPEKNRPWPRPGTGYTRAGGLRPGLHARFCDHPARLRQRSCRPGHEPEASHGALPLGDGPKVWPCLHLRALPALRRDPRSGRGQWHQTPAHLDRRARQGNVARPAELIGVRFQLIKTTGDKACSVLTNIPNTRTCGHPNKAARIKNATRW